MSLNKIYNKARRELYKSVSKWVLKSARGNYFGLNINLPILYGIGVEFLVPKDPWMSHCLSIFLQQKDGIVVDIGANTGLYLLKLKAIDSEREYLGFEPNPIGNHYTQELIRMNNFQHVRILPFALSSSKDIRSFYIAGKADKMGSFYESARFGDSRKYSFDVLTYPGDELFDIVGPKAICAMKIDVEGAEVEVIKGLRNTISKFKPFIYCEIWRVPDVNHPTYQEKYDLLVELLSLINSLNYKIIRAISGNVKVLESIEDFKGFQSRDYILTHESDVDKLIQHINAST